MKTKQQILELFCAGAGFGNRGIQRHTLTRPWQHGDYAYASNRHWIVRMPIDGLPEYQQSAWKHAEIEAWFASAPFEQLAPMQHFDCPPCRRCLGSGFQTSAPCIHCGCKGCTKCDEEGWVFIPAKHDTDGAYRCYQCDGIGLEFDKDLVVPYMDGLFQSAYLSVIGGLPDAKFATRPATEKEPFPMAAFSFDGGKGLLMPCRAHEAAE